MVFTTFDTLQLKKIDDCEKVYIVNPLYLIIGKAIGHIEENKGDKYLVFDLEDENKEVLKKYTELWDGIKNKNEITNDGEGNSAECIYIECKCGNGFTKIKFDTNDDLPLNEPLNLHMLKLIVRSVFEDEGKFYPQVYLDECL